MKIFLRICAGILVSPFVIFLLCLMSPFIIIFTIFSLVDFAETGIWKNPIKSLNEALTD